MGLLPKGLFRSRDTRPQGLPLYEKVTTSSSGKDRYSDDDISSSDGADSDGDDDEEYDYDAESTASSPRSAHASSRQSSGTATSSTLMLPKRAAGAGASVSAFAKPPRRRLRPSTATAAVRAHIYRLPNKVIRYLCTALVMTIIVFIVTLIRASQLENRRIANGLVDKPPAAPPAWESFDFLTRYYGGVRNLVPLKDNAPQYPREEDEQPYDLRANDTSAGDATGTDADAAPKVHLHAAAAAAAAALHKENKAPLPPSAAFDKYKGYVMAGDPDHITPCYIDDANTVSVPPLRYFDGRPNGFPQNIMGSYELLSLPEDICFERFGRFGPYGYGYSVRSGGLGVGEYGEKEGAEAVWEGGASRVDYRKVDWSKVQQRCYNANTRRFKPTDSRHAPVNGLYVSDGVATGSEASAPINHAPRDAPAEEPAEEVADSEESEPAPSPGAPEDVSEPVTNSTASAPVAPPKAAAAPATPAAPPPQGDLPRTAVVIRCWDEFVWHEEDIMNLRALITELSLASGARYDVHLLVQVKNDAKYPIWADDEAYKNKIDSVIPPEFRGLVTLWTETQMLSLYQGIHDLYTRGPGLPVHGVYRGLQMAMQHFSYNHPEYEYFWQWEMDIRYTGHHLDLFTKMENWAKEQPRKGLWERNSRFYIPSVHGSWDDFRQMARVQTEAGFAGVDNVWSGMPGSGPNAGPNAKKVAGEQTVWGPVRPADPNDWFEPENDPVPPTSYDKDRYSWGVDEEADLITLNPIFDPEGTTWLLADDITGYNETAEKESGQTSGKPRRRAQIITASRMSRRMLHTMHRETAFKKHHAFSEMWPATAALQHGYKAVYVPHPVYVDREWPTQYMARTFNSGRNGASGGSRMSVFGQREHNFLGLSWYYNAGFSPNLYRRWLGLKVNGDGGAEFEENADVTRNDSTVSNMRGGEGRMCLPAMLLHPIKNIELPVESHANEDYNKPDSDLNPGS